MGSQVRYSKNPTVFQTPIIWDLVWHIKENYKCPAEYRETKEWQTLVKTHTPHQVQNTIGAFLFFCRVVQNLMYRVDVRSNCKASVLSRVFSWSPYQQSTSSLVWNVMPSFCNFSLVNTWGFPDLENLQTINIINKSG